MNGLEKKVEEQCQLREQVEKELRQSRQQAGSSFLALESREAQAAKQSLERYGCVPLYGWSVGDFFGAVTGHVGSFNHSHWFFFLYLNDVGN